MTGGALEGLKIVDIGQLVSAPYCAKLFADYGADVIKVEPPGTGDLARSWGPFPGDEPHLEKSGLFHFLNTNKRGITLDLSRSEGRDLLLEMLEGVDAVVDNHLPPQMRAWGLDFEALSRVNPDLVLISITPYGQTGPYSDWKGADLNAYHMSGAGHRYCGRPGETPLEHGTFAADFFGATTGASWGMAALYGRERVGGGQHVDVSSAEAIAATFVGGTNIGGYAQDGVFERRTGVGMPLGAPATILPCKDGHVWMLALEPGQWKGLSSVMGNPEWMELEMFQTMSVRAQNADAIYPLLLEWTMEHGTDHGGVHGRGGGEPPATAGAGVHRRPGAPGPGAISHPGCALQAPREPRGPPQCSPAAWGARRRGLREPAADRPA